jgi:O-antigen ligase
MIAFLLGYLVTILFNADNDIYMYVKHLIYNGILLLVIYAQKPDQSEAQLKKLLQTINNIIVIIAFIAGVISIIMFLLQFNLSFKDGSVLFRQGVVENRLFGVYTSPNTGSLFGIVSIIAGCVNSVIITGRLFKWRKLYIINAVVQYIYYSLSLSNGGLITFISLIIVFAAVFIYPKMLNHKKRVISICLSIACIIGIAGSALLVTFGIRNVMVSVANKFEELRGIIFDNDGVEENNEIVLERIESGDDLSNGRSTIWQVSLKLWAYEPIVGIGDANIYNLSNDELTHKKINESHFTSNEIYWLKRANGNLHNIYVQVLTCSGFIGLAIFLTLAISVLSRFMRFFMSNTSDSQAYKIIGIVFCLLGAMMVNGFVEAHLLFNRQDPFAVIFWLYAGIGLVLIRRYAENNRKGYAFLCDTPYQVFGAVNFVVNDMENSKERSDICVYHQFKNADVISERLKESGLFGHVHGFKPYKNNKAWYTKLRTLWRLCFPRHLLKAHSMQKTSFDKHRYKHLVMYFFTHFTLSFHQDHLDAGVLLIEDGTGSYFGNIEKDYRSGLFNFFNRFFMKGALDYHPQRLYVNNPALCHSTMTDDIRRLPRLNDQNPALGVLKEIFGFQENSIYMEKRAVYLTQPLDEVAGYINGMHMSVIEVLESYKKDVLLRVHPRQMNTAVGDLDVDDINNLWELECIHHITDSHVLIGAFSTAQLAPKLLCDREPYLVFTYKLYFGNTDSEFWRGTAGLIEQFNGLYLKGGKIFVPESMEELQAVLDRLLGRQV